MNEPATANEPTPWHLVAQCAGVTRVSDLPLLLWPLLWAAWLASEGNVAPSRIAALIIAVLLARSAAWFAYTPEAGSPLQIPRERRPLAALFLTGALCFALPLGWAGLLIPVALALLAGWMALRRRSYLSDPLLALALALPAFVAWMTQGGPASKAGGLLALAILLWLLAVLMIRPMPQSPTALALLAHHQAPLAAVLLKLGALSALALAGRVAHLGIFFWLGALAALGLTFYQFGTSRRPTPPSPGVLESWWGAAVFCAISFHFLCACQVAAQG